MHDISGRCIVIMCEYLLYIQLQLDHRIIGRENLQHGLNDQSCSDVHSLTCYLIVPRTCYAFATKFEVYHHLHSR